MTDREFLISQEERRLALLRGVVIGATAASLFIGLIHLLIYLGL